MSAAPDAAVVVPVAVPGAAYDVVIGTGLLDRLCAYLPASASSGRVALVCSGPVVDLYADRVGAALAAGGLDVHPVTVPDGEPAKTTEVLDGLWRRFAAIPLRRSDLVVALGGGVVGDLAGFAAATYNRGVAVAQVPTTVLAQVDAAIGGKTGINLPEGKNLVGAFHQPVVVVADTATPATLPVRERRAGLGEVAKYGFIADPGVLDVLECRPARAVDADPTVLTDIVRRAATIKARIVATDEREAGERALLNYGHTVGHAVETLTGYGTYRHGEAVGLGMVFAARLGEHLGVSEAGLAERTIRLLDGLGLPSGGVELDPDAVWEVLGRDKKARDGVRFVLCRRPGDAVVVDEVDRAAVETVLRTLV